MMEKWLLLALVATLCWGIYNFGLKLLIGKEFMNSNIKTAVLFVIIGAVLAFSVYFIFLNNQPVSFSNTGIAAFGIFLGVVWAVGFIVMLNAITSGGDISRITPIFNISVLITVFLAILFLNELPNKAEAIRVIIGAILTIIGAALVIM